MHSGGDDMSADRRRFLHLFGAGCVFGLASSGALAAGVSPSLQPIGPGYRTRWTPLETEDNRLSLFVDDGVARRIVDAAYRASGLRGDAPSMDYAIFDIGATPVKKGVKDPSPTNSQAMPDFLAARRAGEASAAANLAVRESRAGGFIVRLLRRDEVSGVWSVGPAIVGDLDLRRAPAGLTDPVAPATHVPAFVVLDKAGGFAWSRHSPSGVWYPAGSHFIRPGQHGPQKGRAPSEKEIEALKGLSWSNETKNELWRRELSAALADEGKFRPEIYDIPDDPLQPGAGGSSALAVMRSDLFARDSFLWIDLAAGARWVDRGPIFVIRGRGRMRLWRIGDDGSLAGVRETLA